MERTLKDMIDCLTEVERLIPREEQDSFRRRKYLLLREVASDNCRLPCAFSASTRPIEVELSDNAAALLDAIEEIRRNLERRKVSQTPNSDQITWRPRGEHEYEVDASGKETGWYRRVGGWLPDGRWPAWNARTGKEQMMFANDMSS
jgi:hypothetical protein